MTFCFASSVITKPHGFALCVMPFTGRMVCPEIRHFASAVSRSEKTIINPVTEHKLQLNKFPFKHSHLTLRQTMHSRLTKVVCNQKCGKQASSYICLLQASASSFQNQQLSLLQVRKVGVTSYIPVFSILKIKKKKKREMYRNLPKTPKMHSTRPNPAGRNSICELASTEL